MHLEKLELKDIYMCANLGNKRAVRFYDKNGYKGADGTCREEKTEYGIFTLSEEVSVDNLGGMKDEL